MTRVAHLATRFFTSLRPRVDGADVAWAQLILTPAELTTWRAMSRADQSESLAVARRFARAAGPDVAPKFIAAALLHDVGKTDAHLGTVTRVGATVVAGVVSHGRARRWPNRVGRYISHDDRGAEVLAAAGARPDAVAWAGAHHRRHQWPDTGIPTEICELLAAADGEK